VTVLALLAQIAVLVGALSVVASRLSSRTKELAWARKRLEGRTVGGRRQAARSTRHRPRAPEVHVIACGHPVAAAMGWFLSVNDRRDHRDAVREWAHPEVA